MNISTPQLETIEKALTLQTSWSDALKVVETIRENMAEPDLISIARDHFVNDDIEVDDDAATADSGDGCWVQAWVYVHKKICECQESGIVDPETGAIDCGKCDGSGYLGWEE